MVDPGASLGAVPGGRNDDPLMNLIAAARDAWTLGLAAFQVMAQQTEAAIAAQPGPGTAGHPLSALAGISAGLAAAMSDVIAQRTELHPAETSGSSGLDCDDNLSSLMVQTWIIGAVSTLRYWRDLAGVCGTHQSALMQSLARRAGTSSLTPDAKDRLFIDELRAFLREIGDTAARESRRLEIELAQIGEVVARGAEQPTAPGTYQRRWKAKD